ncbi:hypothetical protein [Alkalihalobacillus trypoxylicola]|uniref:hypothetical protein n=1 Tax=Alkalihalobacillus trypoxylicola TaxID=519424 RepID=UPI000A9AF10D|nr:hypothetical protein [Alkalihalobacillus trypoxylicola]
MSEDNQKWGVCYETDEGWKIQGNRVYSDHDFALQEAMMWTFETGMQHVVKPVHKKNNT